MGVCDECLMGVESDDLHLIRHATGFSLFVCFGCAHKLCGSGWTLDTSSGGNMTDIVIATPVSLVQGKGRTVKLDLPEFGSYVHLTPQYRGIKVYANDGILVDNLLYSFDGFMIPHGEGGKWYFTGSQTVVPSLAPKRKAVLLSAVTQAVNSFLDGNPAFAEAMKIVEWEAKARALEQEVANFERSILSRQKDIEHYTREIERKQEDIREMEEKLIDARAEREAHDSRRPKDFEEVLGGAAS